MLKQMSLVNPWKILSQAWTYDKSSASRFHAGPLTIDLVKGDTVYCTASHASSVFLSQALRVFFSVVWKGLKGLSQDVFLWDFSWLRQSPKPWEFFFCVVWKELESDLSRVHSIHFSALLLADSASTKSRPSPIFSFAWPQPTRTMFKLPSQSLHEMFGL